MNLPLPFALSSILAYRPLRDGYRILEMGDNLDIDGKADHLCVLVHG